MTTSYFWMNIFRVSSTCPRGNNSKESIHLVVYSANPSHLHSGVSNLWCIYGKHFCIIIMYVIMFLYIYYIYEKYVCICVSVFARMNVCTYTCMHEIMYVYTYLYSMHEIMYMRWFFLWWDYNEVSKKFKRSHSLQDEGWLKGNYISLRFPQRAVLIF